MNDLQLRLMRGTKAGNCLSWVLITSLLWLSGKDSENTCLAKEKTLQAAVCRISNHINGANNLGSGTLIHKTANEREGLILTCAHLFREGTGKVIVNFENGSRHQARLVSIDHQADLAALSIGNPKAEPVEIAYEANAASTLHACGYGPQGIYRCAVGSVVGQAASTGQTSLLINDAVRSGDSGGGVFDQRRRLVAVIWGEANGITYASSGKPLRRFIGRVLGQRSEAVYACPNGVCPRQPAQTPSFTPSPHAAYDDRWATLQQQLDELRKLKQDRGDYVTRAELPEWNEYASLREVQRLEEQFGTRHASLIERLQNIGGTTVGQTAVGLLGLSGPMGWAVLAASSVGGWLIGRRINSTNGARGRRKRRFRQSSQRLDAEQPTRS